MKKIMTFLFPFALVLACTPKEDTVTSAADYKVQLQNLANDVILPTYADLYAKTDILVQKTAALQQNQTLANLKAARQAWRNHGSQPSARGSPRHRRAPTGRTASIIEQVRPRGNRRNTRSPRYAARCICFEDHALRP